MARTKETKRLYTPRTDLVYFSLEAEASASNSTRSTVDVESGTIDVKELVAEVEIKKKEKTKNPKKLIL
jgi:hypothetical protein